MKLKVKKKKTVYRRPEAAQGAAYSESAPKSASGERRPSHSNTKPQRQRREREDDGRKRISVGGIVVIFLCVCLVAGMITLGAVAKEILGSNDSFSVEQLVEIPEGSSTTAIGELLKENEVIGNVTVFKAYCRFKGVDVSFQAGPHTFNSAMKYSDIIEELQTVVIAPRPVFTVTFPEGTTVAKMGLILSNPNNFSFLFSGILPSKLCTVYDFVNEAQNGEFDNEFLKTYLKKDDNEFIWLEGCLYPETYEFYSDGTPHEWIQTMLNEFEKRVINNTELMEKIESSSLSFDEVLTLASMIEKESTSENKKEVSGAFWNRLNNPAEYPKLQSCTTGYVWEGELVDGFIPGVLEYYYEDVLNQTLPQAMIEAYDTYRYVEGLPIGAICNPSAAAIEAAVTPEDVPYYYWCNDNYGNTYWGYEYSQHELNIKVFRAMNEQKAMGVEDEAQARINTGYDFSQLIVTDSPEYY